MKRAENMAKKRELFMLIRQLQKHLYGNTYGPDSKAQKRTAWEEVFRKGKELGLSGASCNVRQFRKNCVDNVIRASKEILLRQKKEATKCGREVVNSLDEILDHVIGRGTEQESATGYARESDPRNRLSSRDVSERVLKTVFREQLQQKEKGFSSYTDSVDVKPVIGAVPLDTEVMVDWSEPADETEPGDGVMPVDGEFSDKDEYPNFVLDCLSPSTLVTGDQDQSPASTALGPRSCTICGTCPEPGPSPTVRLEGEGDINTAQRGSSIETTGVIDRRALAAEYRVLLARPDEERTDEERAKVQKIITLRLLERLVGDSSSTSSDLRRLSPLALAMLFE